MLATFLATNLTLFNIEFILPSNSKPWKLNMSGVANPFESVLQSLNADIVEILRPNEICRNPFYRRIYNTFTLQQNRRRMEFCLQIRKGENRVAIGVVYNRGNFGHFHVPPGANRIPIDY